MGADMGSQEVPLVLCLVVHFTECAYLYFPIYYHTRDIGDWYMGKEAQYT